MVHALSESWRMLEVGGKLIDLRPYCSEWYVEIISKDSSILVGHFISKKNGLIDDDMADKAITEVISKGEFKKENHDFFDYTYYWDSVDQMLDYVRSTWSDLIRTPKSVFSKARKLEKAQNGKTVIRIRRKLLIASYEKLSNKEDLSI